MTNCLRCGLLRPNLFFDTAEYLHISVFVLFHFTVCLYLCVVLLLFTFIINNHNQSILHVRFLLLLFFFRIGLVTFLKVCLHSCSASSPSSYNTLTALLFPSIHFHSTRIAWFIGLTRTQHIETDVCTTQTTNVVPFFSTTFRFVLT